MKTIISLIIALIFPALIYAQGYFGKSFCVGSSLTFIHHYEDVPSLPRFNEYTWNINAAVQISKRLDMGVQALAIFMKPEGKPSKFHHIIGAFSQFHFIKNEKIKAFLETSLNTGNYKLSNSDFLPTYSNDIIYLGWGGGVELRFSKKIPHLFIDLSFINYTELNVEGAYAFTQYIVGLNYRFGHGYTK